MASKDFNTKTCTACNTEKDLSEFHKQLKQKDGLKHECKSCSKEYYSSYMKEKNGVASMIYGSQRSHSKKRGHSIPDYTKELFKFWLFTQYKFHMLYDLWVASGYLTSKKPSCDRIDDYKPYTLDNLQIMTWQENNNKGLRDKKNGINNKDSKAVIKIDLDGRFIEEHHSASYAERITKVSQSSISACCLGKRKTAGGFKWKFAENI